MYFIDKIKSLLTYNPDDGKFYQKNNGEVYPTKKNKITGQLYIDILEKDRMVSKLAWLFVYGEYPDGRLKHINGDKTDNRIVNLTTTKNYNQDIISQEDLKKHVTYDPKTGIFTKRGNNLPINKRNTQGNTIINIGRKQYQAHRMAWLYVYGELPNYLIKHINGDKTDNRIENLKMITTKKYGKQIRKVKESDTIRKSRQLNFM